MTSMVWLLIAWGVLTALLIILLIYRGTLTMHEEDQLFLSESDAQMEQEQIAVLRKVNKLTPLVWSLGSLSGVLILIIAGMAVYQGLTQIQ